MKINLTGYQIDRLIYDGSRTLVYRGVKKDEGKSVVIKTLHREYPNFNDLLQFRHQYVLTKNISIPGIVRPISLEKSGNGYVLIMEDVGGIALSEYLKICDLNPGKICRQKANFFCKIGVDTSGETQKVKPTAEKSKNLGFSWEKYEECLHPLDEFFLVGLTLIEIIEKLHQKRIIHKDIKPANILINPATEEIFLIDFSIASLLPKETQELQNPNQLEGTLAYISPEQTGRMNRGIDYRSDFYSLGVTFYEILTGQLPFESKDAMELVHCHIAKIPTPPRQINPQIPKVISDMVMKLMAKNAEERYQSARGIRRDLERCWEQWQQDRLAIPFELGQGDVSDRFTIPEKLYGRETEVKTLLEAFDRIANPPQPPLGKGGLVKPHTEQEPQKGGQAEMILVAGFSGIGKTAVVNEVRKPIVEKRGYFIKGKFDQFNRNIPFSALVTALRDLMGQLLGETDAELEGWKQQILGALGEQGRVIIEVIPELENIIGPQPEVSQLSGSAAQNRFNLLFGKFIRVFATKAHPLVLFLDDLQWADSASLKLMELLILKGETSYLLLVGAYRDNEVDAGHPLVLALEEIGKTGTRLHTITLSALSEKDINYLVAETLRCALEVARPLTELVYQKAKGNPFFSNQFLKSLHEDGLISFNSETHYWQCDLAGVKEMAIADDVVEFMAGRISKLLPKTQEVLKLAACIGNQFDLATLAIVNQDSLAETAANLWQALEEGLILPTSKIYNFFAAVDEFNLEKESANLDLSYKFLHDRVQQAAYSSIAEADKQQTHLKIGELLLQNLAPEEREPQIFALVNQLNIGRELIAEPSAIEELAKLNLIAAKKAKNSTAYSGAAKYLTVARGLPLGDIWQEKYQLALDIYTEATEVAYLSGDFEEMEKLGAIVLAKAKSLLEKIKIYEIRIVANIVRAKALEAIAIGREILKQLGTELPEKPTPLQVEERMAEISNNLQGKSIEQLIELPPMKDAYRLGAMQILSYLWPAAYIASPKLMPLMIFEMVNLSLKYGNSQMSAVGYSLQGTLLCGVFGDIESGYQFGRLALNLLDKFNAREFEAKVLTVFGTFVQHWKEHISNTLPVFREGYSKGLETGDLEYAGYLKVNVPFYLFWLGHNLAELETEIAKSVEALKSINQQAAETWVKIYWQAALNLQGNAKEATKFLGSAYNEEEMLPLHRRNNDLTAICHFSVCKLMVTYLCEDYPEALKNAEEADKYLGALTGLAHIPGFYFYDTLTRLALCDRFSYPERKELLQRVETNLEKMKNWALHGPMNYWHKLKLMEAERHRVLGQRFEAMEMYDRAIAVAGENGYVHEEALANELAAKFYLEWGKEKIARSYMVDAYYGYARWGALAKTQQLEGRYPNLLAAITNQGSAEIPTDLTKVSISATNVLSSTTGVSALLDFTSAIKASQALSQVLDLQELISKMMQAATENAGASKGALLLPVAGSLVIEAIANYPPDADRIAITSVGRSLPLDDSQELPISLINTVRRSRKMVVLNYVGCDDRFIGDRYLRRYQPQSVLCTPLLNRGKLIAILYLENSLAMGAFTSDRLSLLDILTSQAAISLENARLYKQSQNYSLQLEQYLKQLQEAQLQLVQSEKMATIGQLTAGVAHEINNPVGFISGNLDYASEYLQNLKELLELYQQGFDGNSATIQSKIEEIELDYLLEDFTQLISSMKDGTNRITEISKSMRTFSRSDTAEKVLFNLHDGIDSTLLILKHRLKANENRPEIQVVKNYGYLPEINCYPGQLNQVFMNTIANAIDAFDEGNIGRSFEQIKSQQNRITITTKIEGEKREAVVRIGDNGPGISEEVKQKIFDNLFTTKAVGKGTGLGLSISRKIVEEKHGGTLTCTSEVGKGTEFAIALPL